MRIRKYISALLFVITITTGLGSAAVPAFGQVAGIGASVPVANPDERGNRSLVPGFDLVSSFGSIDFSKVILDKVKSGGVACDSLDTLDTIIKATSLANTLGGLALITNNTSLMKELTAKITLLQTQIVCRETMYKAAQLFDPGSIYYKQDKQSLLSNLDSELKRLKDQRESLLVQLRVASAGFWQSVFILILKKSGEAFSQALVNKLRQQTMSTRIGTDVANLANLAYTGLQLQSATDNKSQQMMIRSMLNNPVVSATGIDPTAVAQAINFAGDCDRSIDISSSSFFQDMYKCGSMPANPLFNQLSAEDKAQFVSTTAHANAASELALGNGYKAGQLCDGNVIQEQRVNDEKYKLAQAKFADRSLLYETLKSSSDASADDLQSAYQDMFLASNALASAPDAFGDPAKVACSAMITPADMFKELISHTLNGVITNFSTFDEHNLPLFPKLMADLAFNLTSKYLFGQDNGTIIGGSGQLGAAIGGGINFVAAQVKSTPDAHNDSSYNSLSGGAGDASGTSGAGSGNSGTGGSGTGSGSGTGGAGTGGVPPAGSNGGGSVNAFIRGVTRVLGAQVGTEQDSGPIMPRGPMLGAIQPR